MHNNDPKVEYLLEKLRAVTPRPEVMARMRADLAAYVDFHTIPERETRLVRISQKSSPFAAVHSWYAPVAGALVVLLMTGTSFAAEKSLPGDTLYPIKVRVSEPVQLALSATPAGKAKTHTEFAERRLQEAEVLAVGQRLDADTQQYLEQQFSKHVDGSLAAAETLKDSGDVIASLDARSSLEARLVAHEDILDEVEDHLEEVGAASDIHASTKELLAAVEVRQDVVRDTRVALERDLEEGVSPTETLAVITKAGAALPKTVAVTATTTPLPAPVVRRVADAEEALQEAKDSIENGDPEDTRHALRKARESERSSEVANVLVKNQVLLTAVAPLIIPAATTTATTTAEIEVGTK